MKDINTILHMASIYENRCLNSLVKIAKIRKLPDGRYRVISQKGKNLGTCKSLKGAKHRLRMIEMFKHMKDKK